MADDILSGALAPGDRVPPHRELAYQLGVSANTTSRAYAEAVRRALLVGEVGRGTFVRAVMEPAAAGDANSLLRSMCGPVDLSQNLPFPGFAEPHVKRVLAEIATQSGLPPLLDYQTAKDLRAHEDAGRIWLEFCGVSTPTGEVIATVGAQHGLFNALMSVLSPGDLLLTETLTYLPVCAMADRLGLQTAQVEMDDQGILPESFEAHCRTSHPKAFYFTPTLQAPTTITLGEERRQAIAHIAERHGVVLIEDDVFGPLDSTRPAPVASHAPDHTIYVSSLSKSVAAGLRVGFLHVPPRLAPALRQAVNLSVWMAAPLPLEIARRLIHEGAARELTDLQRGLARHRQNLARLILTGIEHAAGADGMHIWLPLPDGMRSDTFRMACEREGVLVSEGRSFAVHGREAPEAVRICISHEPDEKRVRKGLQTIADLIRDLPVTFALTV